MPTCSAAPLQKAGFDSMGSVTQIVPVFVGGAGEVMAFSQAVLARGVFVQGIQAANGSCRKLPASLHPDGHPYP